MATSTVNTNKPILPRGADVRPIDSYNRAALYSGKALDFDGVNDDITISNSDSINITGNALTIAGYINTDGSSAWQGICYKDVANTNGFQLFVDKANGADSIAFGIHTGVFHRLYSNEIIENNKWYFVVVTYDGINQSIYINGVLDNSQAVTGNITNSSTQNLYIGRNNSGSERFNGEIGGFKIFNTALTAAQVADLYNNPEKIVPTGVDNTALKLWLPLMEGSGTTAYDGSGNGNHSRIAGATYVNGVGAPVAQTSVIDWNKLYDFDGTDDQAYNTNYNDTTGTKTYKVHFNSHDVTQQDQQVIQSFVSTSAQNGFGATIAPFGGNGGKLGFRVIFNGTTGVQLSWSVINNTFYELVFTIDWAAQSVSNVTLNGESATATLSGRVANPSGGLYLGSRVNTMYLKGIVNYFEVVGEEKWTNASGFKSESGSYDMTISGSPTQILAPQGLTTGRDITGVNLFENVRKQGALNLDGSSWAEVHDNASLDLTTGLSVENWIYIEDAATQGRVLSKWGSTQPNRSFQMFMNNAIVRFLIGDGSSQASLNSTTSLAQGNWHHIVSTYDGANIKIYINGSADATTAETFTIYNSNQPVLIGGYIGGANLSVNPIAQPRIYNRALTAEEVLKNYNATSSLYI